MQQTLRGPGPVSAGSGPVARLAGLRPIPLVSKSVPVALRKRRTTTAPGQPYYIGFVPLVVGHLWDTLVP